MTTRIYTKQGDSGKTRLFSGEKVDKHHLRIESYGTIDELNSFIGFALTQDMPFEMTEPLSQIQCTLFIIAAQLATIGKAVQPLPIIDDESINELERVIDSAQKALPELKNFILPTGTKAAAALHVARTICRRAERCCVALAREEIDISMYILKYLNRLGDMLFVYARLANHLAKKSDRLWIS